MTTDHVFREAIAIAYEKPPKRTKQDALEDAARAVVQGKSPERPDSNTSMVIPRRRARPSSCPASAFPTRK